MSMGVVLVRWFAIPFSFTTCSQKRGVSSDFRSRLLLHIDATIAPELERRVVRFYPASVAVPDFFFQEAFRSASYYR